MSKVTHDNRAGGAAAPPTNAPGPCSAAPLITNQLVRDFAGKLRYYFARKVPLQEVDDLVQLTFIELLKTDRSQVRDTRAFVFSVAKRIVYRYHRTERSRLFYSEDFLEHTLSDDHPHWAEALEMIDMAGMTKCLSNEQREVLQLYLVDEKTTKEISEELAIPLGTVYSRLRLARKNLAGSTDVYEAVGYTRSKGAEPQLAGVSAITSSKGDESTSVVHSQPQGMERYISSLLRERIRTEKPPKTMDQVLARRA